MKTVFSLLIILLWVAPVFALDVFWTRNTEPDMDKYHVYVCRTAGCIADNSGALWIAEVPHPASGAEVVYGPLPTNIEGAVCVAAADQVGNLSACSQSVSFSTLPNLPPNPPQGVGVR